MNDAVSFFDEHQIAIWTIAAGALSNACCAIIGCFLVLRRMSLLGDAISHSVLPGIVVSFLLAGRAPLPMFLAAIAIGLLTAFCTQSLVSFAKVPEDASMGVVFTSMFALGVFLLTNLARDVDLDPKCVLLGYIELVPLNMTSIGPWSVPSDVLTLSAVLVATLAFVLLLWKELKIASFDPALTTAMGLNATLVHYLLMAMVALVAVAAFQSVGSVLVVAMLIVPAATAHLLTDRLDRMVIIAVLVGVVAAIAGYFGDAWLDATVSGMMALVAGAQFALAVLFAPRHGLLAKALAKFGLTLRIVGEDIIATLYRAEEPPDPHEPQAGMAWSQCAHAAGGGLAAWLAIVANWLGGDVSWLGRGRIGLSAHGRRRAASLVRAHRLWEAYLGEHFQLPLDHLHAPAERLEHYLGPQLQRSLESELHAPATDPHGRVIPPGGPRAADLDPAD
jgi:ABC-type Mn2+/Zn2+ transport system permease subunit